MKTDTTTYELRRREVLETATRLFRFKGFEATSMLEIAAAVGLEKPSLYHYIDSKNALLKEICISAMEEALQAVRPAAEAPGDPRVRLRDFVRAHMSTIVANANAHATMLRALRALDKEDRMAVVELRDQYEALLRKIIAEGQSAGFIRMDIPSSVLGRALLGMMNWPIFWFREEGEEDVVALAQQFSEIFFQGASSAAVRKSAR